MSLLEAKYMQRPASSGQAQDSMALVRWHLGPDIRQRQGPSGLSSLPPEYERLCPSVMPAAHGFSWATLRTAWPGASVCKGRWLQATPPPELASSFSGNAGIPCGTGNSGHRRSL